VEFLSSETLFDKWINAKFDSKLVVSVTKKNQYKNLGFSVINGRGYRTKLGDAMSIQLGPKELNELIDVLKDVQGQFFPEQTNE
jgi:hypothetical protein